MTNSWLSKTQPGKLGTQPTLLVLHRKFKNTVLKKGNIILIQTQEAGRYQEVQIEDIGEANYLFLSFC